jgi:hypothetical protein
VVGEGASDCFILTSSHPNGTVTHTAAFAKSLTGEYEGEEVQVRALRAPNSIRPSITPQHMRLAAVSKRVVFSCLPCRTR